MGHYVPISAVCFGNGFRCRGARVAFQLSVITIRERLVWRHSILSEEWHGEVWQATETEVWLV